MIVARQLIKWLQGVDPETPVVVSSDEEGNTYHKMGGYSDEYLGDTDDYEIHIVGANELDELVEEGYDTSNHRPVFVIWP